MPRPLAPPAEPVEVDVTPYVGTYERASVRDGGASTGDDGPLLRTTVLGPLAEMVPDPVDEYPLVPVGPAPLRGPAAGGADLDAGDVLRAADRRALRALRRPGHPAGGLIGRTSLRAARRHARAGRVRVAVGRPRGGRPQSADVVARVGARRLGVEPERIVLDGRTHLRWRFGTGPSRVLVLGHHDTVWPLGSLATHPCTVDDGVLRGPGCFDMKAGLVMAFHALAALPTATASPCSSPATRSSARRARAALIEEEAARLRGRARARGVGRRRCAEDRAQGRLPVRRPGASAAPRTPGLEPERGVNATVELAHQVLAVAALGRPGARHHRHADAVPGRHHHQHRPRRGAFAVDVRVRDRRGAGARRRRDAVAATRCCPAAVLEVDRRPEPAAAGGALVGGAVRPGRDARRRPRPAAP